MNHIPTAGMILPGFKVGGRLDSVIHECERAMLLVRPGQDWRRKDDPDQHDTIAAATFPNRRTVVSVERYTFDLGSGVAGPKSITLARVKAKDRDGREHEMRGDRFLRLYVPVEAKP